MGSFSDQMSGAADNVGKRVDAIFQTAVELTKQSIQFGSEITGAPGQPVDTGQLRNSWMTELESPTSAVVSTNSEYAQPIEDGIGPHGPLTLRSAVGGFHSVAHTVTNFDRIVAAAVQAQGG